MKLEIANFFTVEVAKVAASLVTREGLVYLKCKLMLQKRIECNLELDHVSKETGISTKLIRAIEKADKKPFSSVLSYKMTERKLDTYYSVKLKHSHKENKIPSFLRSKIGG